MKKIPVFKWGFAKIWVDFQNVSTKNTTFWLKHRFSLNFVNIRTVVLALEVKKCTITSEGEPFWGRGLCSKS